MPSATGRYEAEVIPGLEAVAGDELAERFDKRVSRLQAPRPGALRFRFRGAPAALHGLRSVVAVYQAHHFAVPRPKALLGHEHFTRLTRLLHHICADFAAKPSTIGIGAAGSGSAVMRRLRAALAEALALLPAEDGKGELFLRLLPSSRGTGWDILIRTSRQPLSKRGYRLADMPGALNATVAYAMTRFGDLPRAARVVNLCSGTSTILIEHGLSRPGDCLYAIDNSSPALAMGSRNSRAAHPGVEIRHLFADAKHSPLAARSVDRLYADLPFGHHIGSHEENIRLYPALLREAARIARPHACFVVLTHELRLMRRCLLQSPWQVVDERAINLRGLHPRLFVLNQNSARIVT